MRHHNVEDRVVLCVALFQSIKEKESIQMHETLKEVTRLEERRLGRGLLVLGTVAWLKENFCSAREEQDIDQAWRMCEDHQGWHL